MRGLQAGLAALAVAACSASPHPMLAPDFTASCRAQTVQGRSASVQWSEPADGHRARLDSWCAGVGPILFRDEVAHNDESNVCVHAASPAQELQKTLLEDLSVCERVDRAAWRRRGGWSRCQELVAAVFEDQA